MNTAELPGTPKKFFYGYIIVFVSFCIQVVGWGIYAAYGVFFTPLLTEYGWTRAVTSGAASLSLFILGLSGIITGILSDKFGPRVVMAGCGLFIGLGYILMSQVESIWQLYLFYGLIVAVGTGGLDVIPLSAIARWFARRRGLMSGIVKLGTGTGMLIMPLIVGYLITTYDWQTAYLIVGGLPLIVIIAAAQLLRRDPSQKGLNAYGSGKLTSTELDLIKEGLTLRKVIGLKQFWVLGAMCVLIFYCIETVIIHIVPYGRDLGFSVTVAAGILSAIGGASMLGRVGAGFIGDRIGSRPAMAICFSTIAVALVWLQFAQSLWMLYLFAMVYGFAHGGFWALISPIVADLFGLTSHGAIFGALYLAGNIGGALGPLLAGYIFDVTGNYRLAFLVPAILAIIAAILSIILTQIRANRVHMYD